MVNESSRQAIDLAYKRNQDRPIAYIDESYRSPRESGRKFYIAVAVVVPSDSRNELRAGLTNIVGADYWHTKDEIKTETGYQRALEILNFLSAGSEICVASIRTHVDANDRDLEHTRRSVLSELIIALQRGNNHRDSADLVLLERRKNQSQRNADAQTRSLLIQTGALSQNVRVMQISPHHERLLWLPDLVCTSIRRVLVDNKDDLYRIIKPKVELLPQKRSNPLLP